MTITSTEFQQNVGTYLKLAEKGEEVKIKRNKNNEFVFKIVIEKVVYEDNRIKEKMKKAEKFMFSDSGLNGLEFQKRVRE